MMSAVLHNLETPNAEPNSLGAQRVLVGVGRYRPRTDDRRIQLVLLLLEENSHRQFTLHEAAVRVNLSPGRLAHLFKTEVGISVQQYLTQLRENRAKYQLESTFLSVKEIAAIVGFPSVQRFSTAFKTAVGMTPAEYRRQPNSIRVSRKDVAIARSQHR